MRRIQDFSGFFDETTLVLCGDAIIDLDIGAALAEHHAKQAMASVVALEVPEDQVQNYGIVVADPDGRITSFQEKPKPAEARSRLASTGIDIFEPSVIDLVPPGQEFDIGSQLFPLLVEKQLPFYAQNRFFNWIDIGRVSDYWAVCQRVLRGEVDQMQMPGTEVRPGVWVGLNTRIDWDTVHITGPVYIGSSTCIEPGVTIEGPTWIGHGACCARAARWCAACCSSTPVSTKARCFTKWWRPHSTVWTATARPPTRGRKHQACAGETPAPDGQYGPCANFLSPVPQVSSACTWPRPCWPGATGRRHRQPQRLLQPTAQAGPAEPICNSRRGPSAGVSSRWTWPTTPRCRRCSPANASTAWCTWPRKRACVTR